MNFAPELTRLGPSDTASAGQLQGLSLGCPSTMWLRRRTGLLGGVGGVRGEREKVGERERGLGPQFLLPHSLNQRSHPLLGVRMEARSKNPCEKEERERKSSLFESFK